jgi:hypothetical protein
MPKPHGWSTEMLNRRDRCVKDLMAKGKPQSNAYAICTASIGGISRHKSRKGK